MNFILAWDRNTLLLVAEYILEAQIFNFKIQFFEFFKGPRMLVVCFKVMVPVRSMTLYVTTFLSEIVERLKY
jgi:hypothetical protein